MDLSQRNGGDGRASAIEFPLRLPDDWRTAHRSGFVEAEIWTRDMTYESRVASQIAQYAEGVNVHKLPQIFHFWSNNYLLPPLRAVFASKTINDFYASACLPIPRTRFCNILSIGCGDGSVEIELAKSLTGHGVSEFLITGADLSPILLGEFRKKVENLQLEKHFRIVETDLNSGQVHGPFDMIMANHSLHHIVELEKLFEFSHRELKEDGIFATADVIGRNGHMRWPESQAVLEMFWPLLKPKQRYHCLLGRLDETFVDHDCSTEGFEGIRAQDILPLLLKTFRPLKFVGVGGFVDLMVDRGYGHGFDPNDPDDLRLIKCMADLNEIMLDAGAIKPTLMFAHFVKYPCDEISYRGRTAANSVRHVVVEPIRNPEPETGAPTKTTRSFYRRLDRSIRKRLTKVD